MTSMCKTNGITISYDEQGTGEPLFLIMGLGAPGAKWEPHVQVYKEHFRCIIIDNRGSGLSDRPILDAYSIDQMADDVIGVMDALGIKSAHFHGISMGGAISQKIAIKYPDRVRSLILTSTYARMDAVFKRAIELLRDCCGQIDNVTLGRLCQWIVYSHKFMNEHEEFILDSELKDKDDPYPMPVYAYKAQCNACLAHDVVDELHKIKAPTLIASGDSDGFASVDVTKEMYNNIPGATLYMCRDGGHVHHWEQLDAFNEITLNFLLAHRTNEE